MSKLMPREVREEAEFLERQINEAIDSFEAATDCRITNIALNIREVTLLGGKKDFVRTTDVTVEV